jgi:hypothetical protein
VRHSSKSRPRCPTRPATKTIPAPEERIQIAVKSAKSMLSSLQKGDVSTLVEATLLQGILSGDIFSAQVYARQRLQNENLRLKKRIAREKLRTEKVKRAVLEKLLPQRGELPSAELAARIREIYGLDREPGPVIEIKALPLETKTETPA